MLLIEPKGTVNPSHAGILTLAVTNRDLAEGVVLLVAYPAGLAVPFLLAALALDKFGLAGGRFRQWMP